MIDDLRPTPAGPRPPVDGFAAALRAGRRRRWRTLRNAAACGTAALATFVAAVTPRLTAGTVTGLEPTAPHVTRTYDASPRPAGTRSPSPTAQPAAGATEDPAAPDAPYGDDHAPYGGYAPVAPGPRPQAPRATGGAPAPAPRPSAVEPEPSYDPDPDPGPPPEPTAPPEEPPAESPRPTPPPSPSPSPRPPSHDPIDLSHEDQPVNDPCDEQTWCVTPQVSARSDGARVLRLRVCRAASDTSGVLRFATEHEADFRITSGGRVVWQWSVLEGSDPKYVHDVAVDRWQCAVWSTAWYRNDLSGDAVPDGRYELGALPRATNLPARWVTRSFDVS